MLDSHDSAPPAGGRDARYILGRFARAGLVLFAVSLITFLLTRAVPGDPFASGERELPEATQIARAAKYGFDHRDPGPVPAATSGTCSMAILAFPFQIPSQTVVDLIKQTCPVTMKIGPDALVSYPLGIALGLLAALANASWIDYG